ncbi:NAD(P)/FAD-dependent oxidoreductase [Mesobacillus subterraneus]|uniref:NAD(P)/FAD-dependent oxidoreductase n=1 Tax=Mesobacillus subterraneus TaxID=285983 RepID=A0A3R9KVL4_9BACI|nr:NAD(P)/FAD-dependent oxidoreductase [Mesobacillus subterraneus]RSD27234.1 NAD(P)/FAD-dependent oxidoreductase [Mesobacillus subterraneus]
MYDCLIIGGGIAGLQAAIQLGRYNHKVLVLDSGDGRSAICQSYHNILGYPDGVSGPYLREVGRQQAEKYGVEFVMGKAVNAKKLEGGFEIQSEHGDSYQAKRLLLATGVMDRIPPFPELMPTLGITVYVCPDCDGYEVKDKSTIVMGSGKAGANMALTLAYFTDKITYVNHENKEVEQEKLAAMKEKGITYVEWPIEKVLADGPDFRGVVLANGEELTSERGFIAFGGNEVKSQLAQQLGVDLHKNKHVLVDPRTKMTNVENVWAAGDLVAHSEQTTIAMGDGMQASIWIHKTILAEGKR